MLNIIFRVDSSDIIGTGHIIRCLNLADYYKNHNIEFICKDLPFNLIDNISKNYKVNIIKLNDNSKINYNINTWLGESWEKDCKKTIDIIKNKEIDWIIIDHYNIDYKWENMIKQYVKNIMVIDDYTNRKHNCNILLNQQIDVNFGKKLYNNNIVNNDCKLLLGNKYIIFNEKFFDILKKIKKKNELKRINIFMGGSDPNNITLNIIKKCNNLNKKLKNKLIFDVVVGASNKHKDIIEKKCNSLHNFNYYYNLPFIGDVLLKADLCIGASGGTSYERCLLRIPTLIILTADNQYTVVKKFIEAGVCDFIGTVKDNYKDIISKKINYYIKNIGEIIKMSENCKKICNKSNYNNLKNILY